MDQSEKSDESGQKPKRKQHGILPKGEDHFTVRWARVKELLTDEYGTAELLTKLQMMNYRCGVNEYINSWRAALPTAIWYFLQTPNKRDIHSRFCREFQPSKDYVYRPKWKTSATSTPPKATQAVRTASEVDADLAKIMEAWPSLSAEVKAYILSLVKSLGK